MKPVFAHLHSEWGHCCFGYIDDSIYLEDTKQLAEVATLHATHLLTRLGFVPHPTKSVFEPTQNLEFLGFLLNSLTMQVKLPPRKTERLIHYCQRVLSTTFLSIRDLASLIGSLVSTFPGVQFGPLHYRTLEHDKNLALLRSNYNFEANVELSPASKLDLNWWVRSLPTSFRDIDHGRPQVFIHTDASQVGWGATLSTSTTQGLWTFHEAQFHINILELLAIKFGLRSLLDDSHDTHIRIQSDNTTAIAYITEMGGCHSQECDSVARDIWEWAITRRNWLSASFIPGKQNAAADQLSRKFNAGTEWRLNPSIFIQISTVFGTPSVDLFASRINHQLETYVSWRPDPGAAYIDAFTVDWTRFTNGFAFPPFCLITRCLQKIVQDQATIILVVPLWPTQAWFSRLVSLLVLPPRVFKVTKDVLTNPLLGTTHPLSSKLVLMACKVSGDASLTARFLQTLPTSSSNRGDQVRKNSIQFTSIDGPSFVMNGKLIQSLRL